MAEITASFEGNDGNELVVIYFSDADAFNKRSYEGLELRNTVTVLKGKTNSEISNNATYCLRSTAVVGTISLK